MSVATDRGYWIEVTDRNGLMGRKERTGIWRDSLTLNEALTEYDRLKANGIYGRIVHRDENGVTVGVDSTRRPKDAANR